MAAASLTLVLVGVAAVTVVGSGSGAGSGSGSTSESGPGSPVATLEARTLVHLPAVSAVTELAGSGYATVDMGGRVVRFDSRTGRLERSVQVGGRPTAPVAVRGDLWVADMAGNQLVELSAATLQLLRSVRVPAGPTGLAVLGGTLWVASLSAGTVTPVDPRSGTVGAPVTVPAGAVRVAAGFGALWVTGTANKLTRLEPTRGALGAPAQRTITVGRGPMGVATGAGSVWVADAKGGTVAQVDPTTLEVSQHRGLGGDPLVVAVAHDRVYVGFGAAHTMRVVSPAPASKVLELGASPRWVLPAGAGVWVATANPGRVVTVGPTS